MFVRAAKVTGASLSRIVFRLLPVILPTLASNATLGFALVMLAKSSPSFFGIRPPKITWGLIVPQGQP